MAGLGDGQTFGNGPFRAHIDITAGQAISRDIRAIFVGTGGTINLTDVEGTTKLYKNVPSGAVISVEALKGSIPVAAGGTATDMIGWT